VLVGIVHLDIGPAVADVGAVQQLRLVHLRDRDAAIPSDLGAVVTLPNDLESVDVVQLSHGEFHVVMGQRRNDRSANLFTSRSDRAMV